MAFITFIYKIGNNSTPYFGKYITDYVSDDNEGLDNEVRYILVDGLNQYRKKRGFPKIDLQNVKIGVLSFSQNRDIPVYSTKKEIQCFDFYANVTDYTKQIYINGKLLHE
jgi:hypothetical protein